MNILENIYSTKNIFALLCFRVQWKVFFTLWLSVSIAPMYSLYLFLHNCSKKDILIQRRIILVVCTYGRKCSDISLIRLSTHISLFLLSEKVLLFFLLHCFCAILCNTVCPKSSDPFYVGSKLLYEMGHYFLDTQ